MKYYIYTVCLFLLFYLSVSNATVPKYGDVTGMIMRFGTYEKGMVAERRKAPDAAAGYTSSGNYKYLEKTVTVKIKKNIGFGFEYKINNLPDNKSDKIEVIAKHPSITNNEGITYTVSRDFWPIRPVNGVYNNALVYFFSNRYEMVPGEWTLIIKYNNKTLINKTFYVEI